MYTRTYIINNIKRWDNVLIFMHPACWTVLSADVFLNVSFYQQFLCCQGPCSSWWVTGRQMLTVRMTLSLLRQCWGYLNPMMSAVVLLVYTHSKAKLSYKPALFLATNLHILYDRQSVIVKYPDRLKISYCTF